MRDGALALALLAGCSTTVEQRCDQAMERMCDHQVACGMLSDPGDCLEDLQGRYVCDPGGTTDAFSACTAALDADSGCLTGQPPECGELFCNADVGCAQTATGCREPGATTTELPICETGDTGP